MEVRDAPAACDVHREWAMKWWTVLLCAAPLLGATVGCGSTVGVTPLTEARYPAKAQTCEIAVVTQVPTDRKYEELAVIDIATGQTIWDGKGLDAMLPPLKARACELGADALVLRNVEPGGTPWVHETQGKAFAVAIKLPEGGAGAVQGR